MLTKIIKRVVLDFEVEGFHKWDNALKQVDFLKHKHRHLFQIKVEIQVNDSDREKEIFIETDKLKFYLTESYGSPCDFGQMSCEHIAEDILLFGSEDGYKSVEVYEDSKGGAKVYLNDSD